MTKVFLTSHYRAIALNVLAGCLTLLAVGIGNAKAHCNAAYVAGPQVAYENVPFRLIERRTSVFQAQRDISSTLNTRTKTNAAASFGAITATDFRSAMPQDLVGNNNSDEEPRQKALVYWLLYVQKLYEEEKFGDVVEVISNLRKNQLLTPGDSRSTYDDGDVDQRAYFSIPNITRILRAYEEPSKLALLSNSGFGTDYRRALAATLETQATTFNFDVPYGIRTRYLPRVGQRALAPAGKFAREQASAKRWDRISNLASFEEVLGVSDDVKDQIDMYITAGSVVGSITLGVKSDSLRLFAGFDCRNDFEKSVRAIEEALPQDKGPIALGALVKANDRYVLTVNSPDHVYITETELARMMAGETVSGKDAFDGDGGFHRLMTDLIAEKRPLVLWAHPMMQKHGAARQATMRFAHAISRAYPELNVVIDEPNPRVPELVRKIGELSIGAKDIYVVVDRQFSVKFQGALADEADQIRKLIGKDRVVFFNGKEPALKPSAKERAVLVITGHSDRALEEFIDHLGALGYLRNNLIVLQSCGNDLSPRLVAKINGRYKAAGIYHYPEKILEQDALKHTLSVLQGVVSGSGSFGRLVRDRANKPATPWNGRMEGVWSVCWSTGLGRARGWNLL